MKQNIGYRLGRHVRHFMNGIRAEEWALQQRGVPHWLVKVPRYLLIAVVAGLLLIGAFYLCLFLVVLALVTLFLSGGLGDEKAGGYYGTDEYLTGYHAMGPEGPGTYVAGKKVSDEDENIY
ncbi:DUF3742 family protein [Salmonella enterica]